MRSFAVLLALLSSIVWGSADGQWERDLEAQRPSMQPRLEARYSSSERNGFRIEAERYTLMLDLAEAGHHSLANVEVAGRSVFTNGVVELRDGQGKMWDTENVKAPSRINLYRRGPYYNEIHWLDVAFSDGEGNFAPVKGEVVFYSYPESCRVGIVLHATEAFRVSQIAMRLEENPETQSVGIPIAHEVEHCVAFAQKPNPPIAWFATTEPRAEFGNEPADCLTILWKQGNVSNGGWDLTPGNPEQVDVGFIVLENRDNWDELRGELEPLGGERLELVEGLQFHHDLRRGDYAVSSHNPGGFSYHYYENRNDYPRARVRIANTDFPRKIVLRHETGSGALGQVECGVFLDKEKNLLPLRVQISKNFAGEKEEKFYNPTDIPFSEIFVPLLLDANEECELVSLQLYQDWGNHPLKQFSSLGAWMDYFHMSTGVTETTCYVPFKFYTGISIADLRGMSGTLWESQPQHDNVGGHIFMEYQAADRPGKRQAMEYVGTSYLSTGPVWSHIVFEYLSTDERIQTTLETFEYPQLDELRNFIRLKIKALADVPIRDWSTDFRIMQIDTKTQSLRYQKVTYIDASGETITQPIAFDGSWTVKGAPLTQDAPTAVLWNSPHGNNAFIVEGWRGTLGGRPLQGLAVSCEGKSNKDSNLVLVPQSDALGVKAGDEIEIDLFIMPFGKNDDDYAAALRERERYGLHPVCISNVYSGELLSNFPVRIRATGDDVQFSIQGGYSTIGVSIEGLKTYSGWYLERKIDDRWERLNDARPEANPGIGGEGQQRFVDDNGLFGVDFRVNLDGFLNTLRLRRE